MKTNYKSIYAAFDPYPSYKGSAIHIDKVTKILSAKFPSTLLLTLPGHLTKSFGVGIDHYEFPLTADNFLKRAILFSSWVDEQLDNQYNLHVGHFRDIWGGLPILKRKHITSIFEVNGLPSIELVNRYPHLSNDTIHKIRKLEDQCLHQSQLIICPSDTIQQHLIKRGVAAGKIHVITNGADIPERYPRPEKMPESYFVYFGALQHWQGVDVLLKSLQYLRDKPELKLVVCSSHKEKFSRPFQKLADKLEVREQVIWKRQLSKPLLHQVIQHAIGTVAPLTECSRNLEQGCSPLKIFESMACQTAIVASDIPVVREIIQPNIHGKLFRPDRPAELARCLRLLADYPILRQELANNAFIKLKSEYIWSKIEQQLSGIFEELQVLVH